LFLESFYVSVNLHFSYVFYVNIAINIVFDIIRGYTELLKVLQRITHRYWGGGGGSDVCCEKTTKLTGGDL
jgi:hypothetical protein